MADPLSGALGVLGAALVVGVDKFFAWRKSAPSAAPLQGRTTSMPDPPSLDFVVQGLVAQVQSLAADVATLKQARSDETRRAETRKIVTEVALAMREELRGKRKGGDDGGERSSGG